MPIITEDVPTEVVLVAAPGQTVFSFDWVIFADDELIVLVDGVEATDFTINGIDDEDGGSIEFDDPLIGGETVTLARDMTVRNGMDLPSVGPYSTDTIDGEVDRIYAILQQTKTRLRRGVFAPVGEIVAEMPSAAERASRFFGFDALGDPLMVDAGPEEMLLRADMLANSGFTLIKHKRSEADTFSRTAAQMELAGMFAGPGISVMHWIDPDYDEAIRDGSLTEDLVTMIQNGLEAMNGEGTLHFPQGGFFLSPPLQPALVVPVGVNVYMDDDAWLLADPAHVSIDVLAPLGSNRIKVNVDGQAIDEADSIAVEANWNTEPQGISARWDAANGLGAEDVTIYDSRFRRLNYGAFTNGAKRWKLVNCRTEKIKNTGFLMGYSNSSCYETLIEGCHFREHGDTAAAFALVTAGGTGHCAYNTIQACFAHNTQQLAQGFAFDVEEGELVDRQHHNLFSGLIVRQDHAGTHGTGGIIMRRCQDSAIVDCLLVGSLADDGDVGIAVTLSQRMRVAGNMISNFRGAGITAEGSTGSIQIDDNQLLNCGKDSQVRSAIIATNQSATESVRVKGNRIEWTSDYAFGATTSVGICAVSNGDPVADILLEDNVIVSPWGVGVYISGQASDLASRVVVRGLTVQTTGAGGGIPVQCYYAPQLTVEQLVLVNCTEGIIINNCAGFILRDVQVQGTAEMGAMYNFTGSTGGRVSNVRIYPANTGGFFGADGDGTGTIFENDDTIISRADGSVATNTDASGDVTVNPGLWDTAGQVIVTVTGTTFAHPQVHTKAWPNFKVRFFDAAGAAIASSAVTFDWEARL